MKWLRTVSNLSFQLFFQLILDIFRKKNSFVDCVMDDYSPVWAILLLQPSQIWLFLGMTMPSQ
jgi:hypothetical protein